VKNAVNYIGNFEETLAAEAARHEVDGVICGHIHSAAIRDFEGFTYINTGDWVESCTAVVEHENGRMELIHWAPFSTVLNAGRVPAVRLPSRHAA
jgi:UDP-2,3-diacylglucosamine pyrophosphatase LpxH